MGTAQAGLSEMAVVKSFMRDVDVVSSIRRLDSVEDYLELLELFCTDGERKETLLPELLAPEGGDLARYVIEVHGLKSAAANIGAEKLSARAKEHEFAGKDGKTDWITGDFEGLMAEYRDVLNEIRRVLTLHGYGRFAPRDDASMPALGAEELTGRLNAALGHLEEFEPREAAQAVEELLCFALPEDVRGGLEQVRSLLKVYEDDQAEKLLRGLAKRQVV